MTEKEYKEQIILYSHMLDAKGLVNSLEGNISVLDRESGLMYITPSGTRKCFVNEENIAILRGDEQVGGSLKRSGEYLLHKEAMRARPDCNAVAHIHAPYLTAYAYCGKDIELRCSTTFALLFEKIPCIPYGEAGTPHIADGLFDALQDSDIVLLGNHGVVAVGKDLECAIRIVEAAEEVLKIHSITKEIGPVRDLTDEEYESLCEHHPGSKRNARRNK